MVKVTIVEGSPEEVIATVKGLEVQGATVDAAAPSAAPLAGQDDEEKVFVTVDVARRVIYRRPLSDQQKTVFITLAKAHPNWVPAATLQQATNYTPAQFAGLMGALGRRLSHTEGYVEHSWLFDAEWDYEAGAYNYRLPDNVLDAVKREKLI